MPANTAGNTTNKATTNITIDTILLCFNKHQAVSKVCDSRTGLDARPSDVCLLQSNSDRQAQLFQDALKHLGQILQDEENVCFYVKKIKSKGAVAKLKYIDDFSWFIFIISWEGNFDFSLLKISLHS